VRRASSTRSSRAPSLPICPSSSHQVRLVINLKTAKALGL
jgi:hypothetical protein